MNDYSNTNEIEDPLPPRHSFDKDVLLGGEDEDSGSTSSSTDSEDTDSEDTDSEDIAMDYHECKELYDDLFPFENYENTEMSVKDKFDKDVVTPFLFGRLVGGNLTVDQAKKLGDLESRRKLYRKLTSLFRED